MNVEYIVWPLNDGVYIQPPDEIDDEYDDLWLEITGNMTVEYKIKIGQIICDKLNS